MNLNFYKYQGTGNDFVIVDNRRQFFNKNNTKLIKQICDRRFGIGADGLILLENHPSVDFKMIYFNSDGNESTMCGNGGRCMAAFAKFLGIINKNATFEAIDGLHEVEFEKDNVRLKMNNVEEIHDYKNYMVLDTGSPHHIEFIDDLDKIDVKKEGGRIRYSDTYKAKGINVNFVSKIDKSIFKVRTYERGVEDETLSCGTGVTAVALAVSYSGFTKSNLVTIETRGGRLQVQFEKSNSGYENIWLIGPAKQVYKGEIKC